MPLIPTEIYSSVLDFAHFALLLFIASRKKKDGQVAACYLIFYSIGRFILEFFRGDLIRGRRGRAVNVPVYQSVYRSCGNYDSDPPKQEKGINRR